MIAGGVSLVLAAALIWYYIRSKQLLDEMWAVDTYQAKELRRMCSGGFSAIVEVEGTVSCDNPVIAPALEIACCWCHTTVERRQQRIRATKSGVKTEYVWEKDMDQTRGAIFKVTDETGSTLVDPTNSDIEAEAPLMEITEDRRPWFEGVGYSDTGEYRITERVFLPTGYAYVLGQANCVDDKGTSPDVLIHYPSHGYTNPRRRFFIISRKTEKQIARSNEFSLKICFWGGVLGFLFAAYCGLNLAGLAP